MNPNIRDEFNDKLKVILEKFVDLGYKEFGKYIKMAANEVAKEEVNKNSRWFEHSRDFLIPIIKQRNELLHQAKFQDRCDEYVKQRCRDFCSNFKNAVEVAKGKWVEYIAIEIKLIGINPKKSQEYIKPFVGHYVQINDLKFIYNNGDIAVMDKDNVEISAEYLKKVFNRDASVDWEHVNRTKQKPVIEEFRSTITQIEFNMVIENLIWHKALGINGISPNILKVLDSGKQLILFNFIREWIEDDSIIHYEWKKSRLVPILKKGDLHNIKNWRGINLIEIASKVVSIFINMREQILLNNNGNPM